MRTQKVGQVNLKGLRCVILQVSVGSPLPRPSMSAIGKSTPVILSALLLLGAVAHVLVKRRLEQRIASASAERQKLLKDLRTDNRRLVTSRQTVEAVPESSEPAISHAPSTVRQMKAATELLATGLFGPFAWTRGENTSVEDEVSAFADALALPADQKLAMRSAAEQARKAVVAAVLAKAQVRLHENSVPAPAETREEADARNRLMQDASPLEQMALSAQMISKRSASRGEREVSIEIPELPEARAAFDAMQASFAQIVGPDVFAFYQAAGASKTIEGMFNEVGLQPHRLSLISRPAGTLSAEEESFAASRARRREADIAAGRSPPPDFRSSRPPPDQQGLVYEFHAIRSVVTFPDFITRSAGGRGGRGGGRGALSGIIPLSGVSLGSSQPITGDALRTAMEPLESLIPAGFVP